MKKNIVIANHALFTNEGTPIYGTGSALKTHLTKKKINFYVIQHSLNGGQPTKIEKHINSKITHKIVNKKMSSFLPIKTLQEFAITAKTINQTKKNIDLFIGIDPLNALYGILLKKRKKVKKVIFYTADYAIQRFHNPVLNFAYHTIDRYVSKQADAVWNVSSRITDLRTKQGVVPEKNFFIPNAPEFSSVKRLPFEQINKHELIIVSTLSKAIDFSLIFKVISDIVKKYPGIKLKVIGNGKWKEQFSPLLKNLSIEKNVEFLGPMSHTALLKTLSKARIGLALYTNEYSWTYFSDSMKARDYLVSGLPVLITDVSSTAEDIKNAHAGTVVKLKKESLKSAIEKLFDDNIYQSYRKNAIDMAKKYDITKIFTSALKNFI